MGLALVLIKYINIALVPRSVAFMVLLQLGISDFLIASDLESRIANDSDTQKVINKLKQARPEFSYRLLGPSDIPGYLRIAIESGPILYVAVDGSHFFDGDVYQVTSAGFVDAENIRLKSEREEAFSKIDREDLIVFSPATETSAIINVFTDIDCGYCRKLHLEVDELNSYGIEVRYLAYPRAGLQSKSYEKIATAWCAEDPQDALTRLKRGEELPASICSGNPVANHFAMGRELGVDGTPAVVLMDGTMLPGYRTAEDFAIRLGLK